MEAINQKMQNLRIHRVNVKKTTRKDNLNIAEKLRMRKNGKAARGKRDTLGTEE